MFPPISELPPYLIYAAPPLVGAFIGYLTNRIAIRMLFRPLQRWTIGPFRIPMTPGVIPSKRHEFAVNIGTMVGEHLLTTEELNKSLHKQPFQTHLHELVHTRLNQLTKLDLGSISNLVPDTYKNYLDIALKTGIYRLKVMIRQNIESGIGARSLENLVDRWLDDVLSRRCAELGSAADGQNILAGLETAISDTLAETDLTPVLASLMSTILEDIVNQRKRLDELLPPDMQREIVDIIRDQTPFVLDRAAQIVKDPEVQEGMIDALKRGLEEMVDTMGPMSTMVKGFLDMKLVDRTIRSYLVKRENDIDDFVTGETMHHRVRAALGEWVSQLLAQPVCELLDLSDSRRLQALAMEAARAIEPVLHTEPIRARISTAVRDIIESQCGTEATTLALAVERMAGQDGVDSLRNAARREIVGLLTSPPFASFLDGAVETLCRYLVNRPIGSLSYLIPSTLVDGAAQGLTRRITQTLAEEMGRILHTLDISRIITEKIDSFDLLRLEALLLSIMQEQFKYINLFGALLGFLIGCVNLLLLI